MSLETTSTKTHLFIGLFFEFYPSLGGVAFDFPWTWDPKLRSSSSGGDKTFNPLMTDDPDFGWSEKALFCGAPTFRNRGGHLGIYTQIPMYSISFSRFQPSKHSTVPLIQIQRLNTTS